jgi:multisubunit Na+/H+ antiporter MnhB subunit
MCKQLQKGQILLDVIFILIGISLTMLGVLKGAPFVAFSGLAICALGSLTFAYSVEEKYGKAPKNRNPPLS